jgi:hypothetical protein
MPTVIILLFAILLIVFVLSQITKSAQNKPKARVKKYRYDQVQLPLGLDFRAELILQALENRITEGLTPSFLEQLKQRIMQSNPNISSAEYEWKLLELKRYFAMNAILRQVPMFSEPIDDIWHEMLMFTREYSQFCDRITGAMIHHTPHVTKQSLPDERAWFDWIYGHLFEFTPFSNQIWHDFYKFPLSKERIHQLETLNESEIAERWFNARAAELFPEIKTAIGLLIQQAKAQINAAHEPQDDFNRRTGMQPMEIMSYAAGAMILYSMMDNGGYESSMQSILPEEAQRREDGSGTGCSSCGSGDNGGSSEGGNGGSDGGSGGSDGGGSGCSSSSCGSGCGGGGGD